MSTFSNLLQFELITNGDQNGTWGTTTNTNIGTLIEQAIAGMASINVTSGDATLTVVNGGSDEARCSALYITGSAGITRYVYAPAKNKIYVISNQSNASVIISAGTAGSHTTGYTVPSGQTLLVFYNGSDFVLVGQTATSSNVANTVVARDSSGNFTAGTITASLTGNVTGNVTGNLTGNVTGNVTGNADTATTATNATNATTAAACSGNSATATKATNIAGGSAGTLPYQTALDTTAQLAAGTTGQVLTSQGAAAPTWATPASGGLTVLGTITTTSGTSQGLTGLTLTGYKQIQCQLNGSSLSTAGNIKLNGNNITTSTSSILYGTVLIDLTTGYYTATNSDGGGTATSYTGNAGLSTASTSITFTAGAGSFDNGSILVYGVK